MPKKSPKLIATAIRTMEARRIVAEQQMLIVRLQNAGEPTLEAEKALQTYESAVRHLEEHERMVREHLKSKIGETRKKPKNSAS
jgi:hypothetical protein